MKSLTYLALCLSLLLLSACKEVVSTVVVDIEGQGKVSDGNQVNCSEHCETNYTHPINITNAVELAATPQPGYELFGWSNCGMEDTCTRALQSRCIDPPPPLGTVQLCENYAGTTVNAHAIFVPEGSIVDYDVYEENKCLINTSGELKCWPERFANSVPETISNPTEVSLGPGSSCVKDDSILTCWGSPFVADVPSFESVDLLTVQTYKACATENDDVVCWSSHAERIIDGPPINNVTNIDLPGSVYSDVCADHDEGRSCWGALKFVAPIPETVKADIFAIADTSTCAYSDSEGLRCWGEVLGAEQISSQLENPTKLGVGWHHLCAIDDHGLRCWRKGTPVNLPASLQDSIDFNQSGDLICTLDNLGNECWRLSTNDSTYRLAGDNVLAGVSQRGTCFMDGQTINCGGDHHFRIAELTNDYQTDITQAPTIAANNNGFCIAGANGVDCQFRIPLHLLVEPPNDLANVTDIAMGPGEVCAIYSGKLACWGTKARGMTTNLPEVTNPSHLQMAFNHACVIDDGELECWGSISRIASE